MQIENLINKSTDTKNTDTKTINDMTAGMRVSDYIKTDSSDNMSKKAAVVGSSNSVDMSDTIYARPQAKNEAGNKDGTDMAENLLNDMNQTSENRRNDMIVTASTTTSDDYKAAKDDGYDVIVTETDKIKAVLAKAGVDISIYGDDLSREQLTDITGSQTEAAMLVNQMKAYDIPATDDNIKAGTDAIDRAKSLTNISDETKAYLVRNNMNPTVSNVYKATYSSSQVQDYRQKTKMTEISDELFEELKPQLKQILEEAHIDSSDENLNQCRWLIDEDIAVTPDNVLLANRVDCINAAEENVSSDFYARAVTEALAMGKKATDATMSQDGLTFDMSELQTLKTAIHEIAHAKLHDIDLNAPKDEQQPHVDRRTREVEAESVAYTVCQHYGLDTSDYSFGYVAGWSSGRELSELKSSLETIRSAAAEIINSIDENLAELQKAQDKEQTAGQEQPTREGQEAAPEKPDPEAAAPGKSGAQEKAGAAPKEAFTPETIYRVRRNPYSDSRENSYLLQAYVTQENGRAKMGDVLYTGTPEKCRELMGQLKSGELTEGDVKQLYAKAQETAQTAGQDKDTFSIYQIKGGDETRDFRFEPYDRLQAAGNVVDRANYELVYSAPLAPETSLEDIYTCFNIDHPKDFKGHSLSVSDVVVLHQDGQDAAHFVDSVGFREVPEFLQEQKQLTPDDLETGETVKTPRGTFHVTAMSREQIEAAGYGFHHQSDDGKYLIMGNGTRAFAVAAEQAQRDNPLKTAEQTTEQNGNMIDGIINNTPTVDELEAKVKAGEQISLVDLANAVKADKERGKGAKPEKKPSIRAQLRADKEKAQKKNAKQKSQDLERS